MGLLGPLAPPVNGAAEVAAGPDSADERAGAMNTDVSCGEIVTGPLGAGACGTGASGVSGAGARGAEALWAGASGARASGRRGEQVPLESHEWGWNRNNRIRRACRDRCDWGQR
jgi:hypothetical protein